MEIVITPKINKLIVNQLIMSKINPKYKYLLGLIFLCSSFLISGCGADPDTEEIVVTPIDEEEEVIPIDEEEEEVQPDYSATEITVSSIVQLRIASKFSGKNITVKPGVYTVEDTMPNDVKTIIHFSGSNNNFNLEGATIIVPTSVLRGMGPGSVHEFATYRIDGSNIVFNGGHFENTGDDRPYASLSEFEVQGNDISFLGCNIIVRGSEPYGYGDTYGKGSDNIVTLYKHAAMSILGDRVLVDGCDFKVFAYGHGIHIHGSQDTVIRNVTMEGVRRLTDEIYKETSGPAYDFGFKIYFPDSKRGLPIPKGEMLSLTEDGIRAYLDGHDVNGVLRRTQNITVENCFVDKMRGGITLSIANGDISVTDNISINNANAYDLPSNAIVRNCKGNAAFGPLLAMPYDHKRDSDIELELIDSEVTMGDHPLAKITGARHKITITYNGTKIEENLRPIWIGVPNDFGVIDYTDQELKDTYSALDIILNNHTLNPIKFGKYSTSSVVETKNVEVEDLGASNTVTIIE